MDDWQPPRFEASASTPQDRETKEPIMARPHDDYRETRASDREAADERAALDNAHEAEMYRTDDNEETALRRMAEKALTGIAESRAARRNRKAEENEAAIQHAMLSMHLTAHMLLDEIADKIDSIDPDTANWGHVGDLGYIVTMLRRANGEDV